MSDSLETVGALGTAPILIFCDHASARIPAELKQLGLSPAELNMHIAVDIGANGLTRDIAARFDTRAALATFSRLIIDPNRSMDRDDFIPCVSDGVRIPGNENLTASDREARAGQFFEPYHRALAREIDAACKRFDDPLFVSIHSFTPQMMTESEPRKWHIGVLWAYDEPTARGFMAAMARYAPQYVIGDNEPYDARGFNYTVDRHVKPLGKRHLTLEVRQDLLGSTADISAMGALLEAAIRDLL